MIRLAILRAFFVEANAWVYFDRFLPEFIQMAIRPKIMVYSVNPLLI